METKNLKEQSSILLSRKRIEFIVPHTNATTPKKEDIKQQIAKKHNVKPELVSIAHIYTNFGNSESKVFATIYEDEKLLKLLETRKGKKVAPAKAAGA
ncbi:MAG TPA: 30S ribosomal protein S24e [Candidatus Nanoarchaeia archaeon]|nr:30S ribosomal protein S24e [Candidatus Nanoarchaeia archaeon]